MGRPGVVGERMTILGAESASSVVFVNAHERVAAAETCCARMDGSSKAGTDSPAERRRQRRRRTFGGATPLGCSCYRRVVVAQAALHRHCERIDRQIHAICVAVVRHPQRSRQPHAHSTVGGNGGSAAVMQTVALQPAVKPIIAATIRCS